MHSELMTVRDLQSGYGNIPILFGVDFTIHSGELVGILGHNGMGKTTLLRTLMGHLPVKYGEIIFCGNDITHSKPEVRSRLGLGAVPQGRQIFPMLSVRENLQMGAIHLSPRAALQKIDEVIEELPRLKPILDRTGGVLSGGEQQILALGRCLCASPILILLDEPTEGIQPSIVDEIAQSLRHQVEHNGLTIILVEQDLEFISQLADRVYPIRKGKLSAEIDPATLWDSKLASEFNGLSA